MHFIKPSHFDTRDWGSSQALGSQPPASARFLTSPEKEEESEKSVAEETLLQREGTHFKVRMHSEDLNPACTHTASRVLQDRHGILLFKGSHNLGLKYSYEVLGFSKNAANHYQCSVLAIWFQADWAFVFTSVVGLSNGCKVLGAMRKPSYHKFGEWPQTPSGVKLCSSFFCSSCKYPGLLYSALLNVANYLKKTSLVPY